jgi:hypothetical protein
MTNEEALRRVRGYLTDLLPIENYDEVEEIMLALEQTRWIPCSERLPEEDGFYLATCDGEICGEDEPISGMAEFENGKWVDDEDDYQCVLAWMPLPEPYNVESEDKE